MGSRTGRAPLSPELTRTRIRSLPRRLRVEATNGLVARWELRIGSQAFTVAVGDRRCTVDEGPAMKPDTVISTDDATWREIDEGTMTGGQAFLERHLTATGNLDLAMRLQTLFRPAGRPRRSVDLDQVDVEADGVHLSTYVLGKGKPVILLHGLGGSKITWIPFLAPLAERYRVIVPDLPGHGDSDKPRADYSPRFYARVVLHLLDAAEARRATLVGNSMGGRVALEVAMRSPDRVAALALLGPAVPGFRWRMVLGFSRVFPTEIGAIPFPLRERWMEVAIRRLFGDPARLPPHGYRMAAGEFIRIYREPAARMAFFATLRHIVVERPEPFYSAIRGIKQPSLVVFGDRDRLVAPRLGARLAEHIPTSELVVLPGVGHVPQFEAPEELLPIIGRFLTETG